MNKKLLKLIDEAEALAELLKDKADEILLNCRTAKATTGGVSTPPNKLHLEKIAQEAVAKRMARLARTRKNQQS